VHDSRGAGGLRATIESPFHTFGRRDVGALQPWRKSARDDYMLKRRQPAVPSLQRFSHPGCRAETPGPTLRDDAVGDPPTIKEAP